MYRQEQFIQLISHRRILIAGYGREGKSTHALFQQLLPGEKFDIASNDQEIFDCLEQASANGTPYDLIVKSPGIPTMKFEGRCSLDTITSQTNIFLQVFHDITLGVTGTKGKSTTTTLIHHVLSQTFLQRHVILAGNIGIPLFDIIPQLDSQSLVVAEFSCHQLENISRAPHIGILLNLYQEHLDHYHNYHDYQMAKMQLMLCQDTNDHCFYCADNPDLLALTQEIQAQTTSTLHPYTLDQALKSQLGTIPLQGNHNLSNIHVAQQATALLGVTPDQFSLALSSFQGLPHRLELVGTFHGITFYNDSISTIPAACIAALRALPSTHTLILGGFDRGIDYAPLGQYLSQQTTIGSLVFVGKAGERMLMEWKSQYPQAVSNCQVLVESDYSRIVSWCFQHTPAGSICLLSPAAASYDAFKNFEERGSIFKNLVCQYTPSL